MRQNSNSALVIRGSIFTNESKKQKSLRSATRPVIESLEVRTMLSVATVNSTLDTDVFDSVLTLREAIEFTNGTLGYGSLSAGEQAQIDLTEPLGTNDAIHFNIPGAGLQTISLTEALPEISKPVKIDGYTQSDASVNTLAVGDDAKLRIELDGTNAGYGIGAISLASGSDGSVVRGLVLGNFSGSGVSINGGTGSSVIGNFIGIAADGTTALSNDTYGVFVDSAGNTIGSAAAADRNVISSNDNTGILMTTTGSGTVVRGNYIGTDATGLVARGNNRHGIQVESKDNTIGGTAPGAGNVISGNAKSGISFDATGTADVSGNLVQGNFIGLNATGTAAVANGENGVEIVSTTGSTVATNVTIGGTAVGARNVISGNTEVGINITNGGGGNVIQGNYIGTNAAGTEKVENSDSGVGISRSTNNLIGGTTAAARNVISGNKFFGVYSNSGTTYTTIQGNYIGTNAAGDAAIGNGSNGVVFTDNFNSRVDNYGLIGGLVAGAGNVITGNGGNGVLLNSSNLDVVQGNRIGVFATGNTGPGNGKSGVYLRELAQQNTIGGTVAAAGNIIAFNQIDGVTIWVDDGDPVENVIRRNSIFSNGKLGINIENNGDPLGVVLPNDPGDPDSFPPNNGQNYPVLTSASATATAVTVGGTLNSKANTAYVLDFYGNDEVDPSGNGEGKQFLGSISVITDGFGNAAFSGTFNVAIGVNKYISATATTTATSPYGDTSEFSQTIEADIIVPVTPPSVSISDVTLNEGNSGTTAFTFIVTRTGDTSGTSDLYYQTVSGGATSPSDYTAIGLTPLHFAANQLTAQITVQVNGDTTIETNESFYVKLSSPTGATIADDTGLGTIVNDDLPPAPSAIGYTNLKAKKGRNNRYDYSGVVASFTSTVFNNASNFTATINWGDSQSSAGSITWNKKTKRWDVSGLHQYINRGTYHLVITITDTNGRTATANSTLTA